jgi:tRNA nucleotidyltransferase/poly(A) polymerase
VKLTETNRQLIAAILESSSAARPILVGGCVRDHFLGVESSDIDIEVVAGDLDMITTTARSRGFQVDEVGRAFGVLKISLNGEDFDVSVPRRDSRVGAGHRDFEVDFKGVTEIEAFGRRDFTINSIGFDPLSGAFIDHFGGIDDLNSQELRHTTEAFSEDPLRVLRGVQFVSRFNLNVSADTVDLMAALAPEFDSIPKSRVWGEMRKLFLSNHPSRGMELLDMTEWSAHLRGLTNRFAADEAASTPFFHRDEDSIVATVMAAALSTATMGIRNDFFKAAGVPTKIVRHAEAALSEMDLIHRIDPMPSNFRSLLRRIDGHLILWDVLILADAIGIDINPWSRMASEVGSTAQKPLITGDDLISAGLKPGPHFKFILQEAIHEQDAGTLNRANFLRLTKEMNT